MNIVKKINYYFFRRKVVYRTLKNWMLCFFQDIWRRRGIPGESVVVCVRLNARARIFNYGWTLRRLKGVRTILVTQVFEYAFQKQAFDEVKIFVNYKQLEKIILKISRRYKIIAVIGSLQPSEQTVVLLKMNRHWPVVIDHYDSYWSLQYASRISEQDSTSFSCFSEEEIEAEKLCFSRADGVLARSGALVKHLHENKVQTPVKLFEDKCNKKYFQNIYHGEGPKNGEWSVVYAGIIYPMHFDKRYWASAQLVPLGQLFAEEKIHFHLYPGPHHNFQYPEYEAEAARNPYFHMHQSVDFDKIHQEISKYDFGWYANNFSKALHYSDDLRKYELTMKFFTYLEAGLPIIHNDLLERAYNLITEFGAGLCVGHDGPVGLRSVIEKNDISLIRSNVEKLRGELEVDQISDELFDFLTATTFQNKQHFN